MIHLDTNVLIGALAQGTPADRALRTWLVEGQQVAISSVVWAEFLCGSNQLLLHEALREAALRLVGEPIPFGRPAAEFAAELFDASGRRRGSLGDCMVAAAAIHAGAALATANVADFRRLQPLGLIVRAM